MNDIPKNTEKNIENISIGDKDRVEDMIQKNFSFQIRVNRFFESSKRKYLEMQKSGKLQKYASVALVAAFSIGILSNQSHNVMASFFSLL